jgi:LysR family transcriptional regulator, cyn operon transcriptional activator
MELRHLRYFIAIADAPTMARAAEAVHVTQSTLSHQLAQLEDELGCVLFERIGRQLRLSEAGTALLGHARGVLAQVDEGLRAVAVARSDAAGLLKVGVIHSFVTGLMPQVCAACLSRYPAMRVQVLELTGPEIEAQVASGALDTGVGFYPAVHDGVLGEKLFDDELVLALPRRHPLAERRSVRFAQLGDVPLAMMSARFATRRILDNYFQRAGVSPRIVVEIDSVDALQKLVELGAAAAFLPAQMMKRRPHIRLVHVTDPRPVRAAGLIWRRTPYRSAAALAFAAEVERTLAVSG